MRTMLYDRTQSSRLLYTTQAGAYRSSPIEPLRSRIVTIELPHNLYRQIAPRSSLAVNYRLTTNAGVIDADYRGEVKVVLVNQENQPYRVEQGDQFA